MGDSVVAVHLSESIWEEATAEASRDGVSLAQWLRSLAEVRLREAHYRTCLSREPQAGDVAALREILARVPDNPPMPGDELPED